MKIQVLGSAAAEGWPALYCECDACRRARALRGKDIRRRTSYLVDGSLLIDLDPDIYWQTIEFGLDLSRIDAVFFTHSHADHCNPVDLLWHRPGFSVVSRTIDLFGSQAVVDKIVRGLEWPDPARYGYRTHVLRPGEPVEFGGYRLTPILASHATPPEQALNYIIQAPDGVTALIGNDSGWWCDESWRALAEHRLDIAVIEATMGLRSPDHDRGHLGANAAVRVRDRLRELGALADGALVAVNHFSHNGGGSHQELADHFRPLGIEVCHDGMTLER